MVSDDGLRLYIDIDGDGINEEIRTVAGDSIRIKPGGKTSIRLDTGNGAARNVLLSSTATIIDYDTQFSDDLEYKISGDPKIDVFVGGASVTFRASAIYRKVGPRTKYGANLDKYYSRTGGLTFKQLQLKAKNGWGVSLQVEPTIGEKSTFLKLNGTVKLLTGFASDGSPVTQEHSLSSSVTVANGNTSFVLGSYDRVQDINASYKVPLLGSIPGIGWLFSSETKAKSTSKVVVILNVQVANAGGNIKIQGLKNLAPDKETEDEISWMEGRLPKKVGQAGDLDWGFDVVGFDEEPLAVKKQK
jgi:hypothetical protein